MTDQPYFNPDADWTLVPEHMQDGLKLYVMHGVQPGSFMTAVLCNDLMGALGKADAINKIWLNNICQFIYNFTPAASHGSEGAFYAWVAIGGFNGYAAGGA